ncbi:hypothetical protein T4B_430 [Trichinella pseudospiralis]|uniref:Protein TAR1 n=1 Tax=Trichinella pseudospiralis TaxID=6337 RepID=A0A0V1GSG3_TRIPS|nr:hypothetical protein T4B_430 [Trichinella pseudospiralis]
MCTFSTWSYYSDHLHIATSCNGPLPRAGSSASSIRLLTRPSLFGDGPLLTSAFPFRSISSFPDGIAITEQQAMGSTRRYKHTHASGNFPTTDVQNNYRTRPPIFMSYFSFGSFRFLRLSFPAGKISLARSVSVAIC